VNLKVDDTNLVRSLLIADADFQEAMRSDAQAKNTHTVDNDTIVPFDQRVTVAIENCAYKGKKIIKKGRRDPVTSKGRMTREQYKRSLKEVTLQHMKDFSELGDEASPLVSLTKLNGSLGDSSGMKVEIERVH